MRRPNSLPKTYCRTSLSCTMAIRKNRRRKFCPSKPGMWSIRRAGAWLTQNTVSIRPHWILAVR